MDLSVLSCAERERPSMTVVAPTTALLIRKVRRSTPGGISCEMNGSVTSSGFAESGCSRRPAVSVGLLCCLDISSLLNSDVLTLRTRDDETLGRAQEFGNCQNLQCPYPRCCGYIFLWPYTMY